MLRPHVAIIYLKFIGFSTEPAAFVFPELPALNLSGKVGTSVVTAGPEVQSI
jgi:hypothetical protein